MINTHIMFPFEWKRFQIEGVLKGCHKKQEIVGNTFRMFGLGS